MKLLALLTCVLLTNVVTTNLVAERSSAASIHGRILDPFGFPVSRVTVEILAEKGVQFRTLSDQQGNYRLADVPAGEYNISVSSLGFITEKSTVTVEKSSDVQLDFGLVAGYLGESIPIEVSGTVRDLDKTPLQDVTVTVSNAFSQRLIQKAKTDKEGRYKIQVDYPGQYIVYAAKPSFMVSAATIVLRPALPRESRTMDLILTRLRSP
jgi:protocatechuate 3,4-dioxygenase beta subunit